MQLHELLRINRKSKRLTLMEIVDRTGLSYGKIHRIFTGSLLKPSPEDLQPISTCLGMDYDYLLSVSGYVSPVDPVSQEGAVYDYPVLAWSFCLLMYPFQEPFSTGLADEHYSSAVQCHNGFVLVIDQAHVVTPFFQLGDSVLCEPVRHYEHGDRVLYYNDQEKEFSIGLYYDLGNGPVIRPFCLQESEIVLDESNHFFACAAKIVVHERGRL